MKHGPAHAAQTARTTAQKPTGKANHAAKKRHPVRTALLVLLILAIAAGAGCAIAFPRTASQIIAQVTSLIFPSAQTTAPDSVQSSADATQANVSDKGLTAEAERASALKTAQVATMGDLVVRSPIAPCDLTGILFHQASNAYAYEMDTQLPTADVAESANPNCVRVNNAQTDLRSWADADALHLWRKDDRAAMDTAIDVGAAPGSPVYAPVTGTVILVIEYSLYDKLDDIQIHIQPDGRPDLDCVILHTTDCCVSAGDKVEAGVTQLSYVRDIASAISGIQLTEFTPEGDGGNHAHVQINNADWENYRMQKLPGAVLTGQETPEQAQAQKESNAAYEEMLHAAAEAAEAAATAETAE